MKFNFLAASLLSVCLFSSHALAALSAKTAKEVESKAKEAASTLKSLGAEFSGIERLAQEAIRKGDQALADNIKSLADAVKSAQGQKNMKDAAAKEKLNAIVAKVDAINGKAAEISERLKDVEMKETDAGAQLLEAMESAVGVLRDVVSTAKMESVDLVKVEQVLDILSKITESDVKSNNTAKVIELEAVLGKDGLAKLRELCKKAAK